MRGLSVMSNLFGAFAIVTLYADSHPPVADRAAETLHLSGMIALRQMVGQLVGGSLFFERAYLHCPSPTGFHRGWSAQYFDADHSDTRREDIDSFGCGLREIQNTAFHKRSAVGDS